METVLKAQVESREKLKEVSNRIYADAFVFKSLDSAKSRIDIYVQIPYSEIKFIKYNERYLGRIELSTTILMDAQQVWQKSQSIELSLKEFSQTLSPKHSALKYFSTDIEPGNYYVLIQISDKESKRSANLKKPIKVKAYDNDTLSLSDIMLVSRVSIKDNQRDIVPNLSGTLNTGLSTFYLFFELYNKVSLDSAEMICKFINSNKKEIAVYNKNELLRESKNQIIWQIDSLNVVADRYDVVVEVYGFGDKYKGKKFYAKTSRQVDIRIKGLPPTITDLNKAIDQLRYVAKGSEMDYIKAGSTAEEKKNRFMEFWQKRDPDPKTPENELMEEYYERVEYANRNFSGLTEGWRTDMGMVLIRFGTPEYVERHPFNAENKPYEIWYYYTLNRQFIFVDETGFGEYKLRYPTTDLWGRIR